MHTASNGLMTNEHCKSILQMYLRWVDGHVEVEEEILPLLELSWQLPNRGDEPKLVVGAEHIIL